MIQAENTLASPAHTHTSSAQCPVTLAQRPMLRPRRQLRVALIVRHQAEHQHSALARIWRAHPYNDRSLWTSAWVFGQQQLPWHLRDLTVPLASGWLKSRVPCTLARRSHARRPCFIHRCRRPQKVGLLRFQQARYRASRLLEHEPGLSKDKASLRVCSASEVSTKPYCIVGVTIDPTDKVLTWRL